MDGLVGYFKAEVQFTKKDTRALVDFFDANGDGDIEPNEFCDVIKQVFGLFRVSSAALLSSHTGGAPPMGQTGSICSFSPRGLGTVCFIL